MDFNARGHPFGPRDNWEPIECADKRCFTSVWVSNENDPHAIERKLSFAGKDAVYIIVDRVGALGVNLGRYVNSRSLYFWYQRGTG